MSFQSNRLIDSNFYQDITIRNENNIKSMKYFFYIFKNKREYKTSCCCGCISLASAVKLILIVNLFSAFAYIAEDILIIAMNIPCGLIAFGFLTILTSYLAFFIYFLYQIYIGFKGIYLKDGKLLKQFYNFLQFLTVYYIIMCTIPPFIFFFWKKNVY